MNIAITFRQMEASDAVKTYANEKVARLQKFLRRPMKCQVTLSCKDNGRSHCAEVDVHSGDHHFHAHEQSEHMYATVDKVIDKLERQITSHNEVSKKQGSERVSQKLLEDVGED
jgi:putative sigma-54 modulation protein